MKDHVTLKAEHSQNFPTVLPLSKHFEYKVFVIVKPTWRAYQRPFRSYLITPFLSPLSYEVMNISPYESVCARSQEVIHSAVFQHLLLEKSKELFYFP